MRFEFRDDADRDAYLAELRRADAHAKRGKWWQRLLRAMFCTHRGKMPCLNGYMCRNCGACFP